VRASATAEWAEAVSRRNLTTILSSGAVAMWSVIADRIGVQLAFVLPLLCYAYIAWCALRGSRPALRLEPT